MPENIVEETGTEKPTKGSKSIQSKWANAPTRADLYNDLSSAEDGMEEYRSNLSIWKETLDGGKVIKTRLGKSTARPRVARKQAEWRYPALSEPILGTRDLFKISPVGGEDASAAKQNGLILNNQWSTKVNKTKLIDDIVRNLVDEGTAIIKTGWEEVEGTRVVEQEEPVYASPEESLLIMQQQVQSGQMTPERAQAMLEMGEPVQIGTKMVEVEETYLVKNQPVYEVCTNANVTIDPTCDGVVADALFAVHEYDTSYSSLKENEYTKDEDGTEYGYYHNIESINASGSDAEYDEFKSTESNNFEFKDKARKRLTAYEYWGYWDIQGDGVLVAIVATWIGNTLIRLEENPFPHGRIPFSVATYMPVKREVHGEPDSELLKENQESIGKMTRAIHDVTAQQAVGQEFIDENLFASPSQKNAYEKGNTVYFRSGLDLKNAIHRTEVQQLNSAPFDVISWQQKDAAELTGTQAFAPAKAGGKLNGTTQQRDSMDSTAKRELSILRRISAMFVDMARMTIAMNQVFLSEQETVRITGDEFVTIARDDLEGNFDLAVEVSTPEKDEDQATKIMTLMQTNAANTDPEIVKMHYVKMAELWKLPDLADAVANYQPQPDPMQQELLSLQLEEQKLKNALAQKQLEDYDSKIYERLSRTDENANGDAALKQAKANQANAATAKIEEETDILAQSFLAIQNGEKRQQDIEDMEYSANVDAAAAQQKTLADAGMEHIKNSYTKTPGKVISEI